MNEHLNQDICYQLFKWFAEKPEAMRLIRERVKEIESENPKQERTKPTEDPRSPRFPRLP